ncbi:hypothetical protein EJB05_30649, partial [Eragrostis curvula]
MHGRDDPGADRSTQAKATMPRVPRRLRDLNLEAEAEEIEPQDEDMQGPPQEFNVGFPEGAPAQNRSFRTAELWGLNGARVLVETDENPHTLSSSFAPLHIPRWDSKLFKGPKERIVRDVEKKIIYSAETKWFTRDWILKTVNKRWRDYKSDLKKQYFKPDERTLEQIEKDVPDGVNENQWSSLLGLWCSDAHKKLCRTNAESGKKQRHPHTSGRKSHARLKKEMEDKKKGSITKIDLWDESHKKKNGNYVNQNVQRLMDKAFEELENRRKNKRALSSTDYDDVFEKVVRKELKLRGYYDDEYWSNGAVSSVGSEENKKLRRDLELAISGFRDIRAFLEKKFPTEEWISIRPPTGSTAVNDTEDDEHSSEEYLNGERSTDDMHDVYCTAANKGCSDPSVSNDNTVHNQSQVSSSSDGNQENSNGSLSPNEERTIMEPQRKRCKKNKSQKTSRVGSSSDINQEHINESLLPDEEMTLMEPRSKMRKRNKSQENQKTVLLFSTRKRKSGQVVAIGSLISRDSTHEIGGTMLGDGYFAVAIHSLATVEDERLPRPYGDLRTVDDALGMCVAWPSSHTGINNV